VTALKPNSAESQRSGPQSDEDSGPVALVHDRPGHLIRRAQQISVSVFLDECQDLSITPVQYAALAAVEANPGLDQATLAGLIAIDRSTAGNVLARLEEKGLAARASDPQDKRFKRATVTAAGQRLLQKIRPRLDAIQERMLGPLSFEERQLFIALLTKMVDLNNGISRAPLLVASVRGAGDED